MNRLRVHNESHAVSRIGWLRAAVLGANDGIISTASLIVGVAAASPDRPAIIVAGIAGLVAGAMSMAAGEYVSVSSQSDTERADIARESQELAEQPEMELHELAQIYEKRGLDQAMALKVAEQLTAHDALKAHAHDELGISDFTTARPVQAALISAATFSIGAVLPLATAVLAPQDKIVISVSVGALVFLALLGALGAKAGGAPIVRATSRVLFWGAFALGLTAVIGRLLGPVV